MSLADFDIDEDDVVIDYAPQLGKSGNEKAQYMAKPSSSGRDLANMRLSDRLVQKTTKPQPTPVRDTKDVLAMAKQQIRKETQNTSQRISIPVPSKPTYNIP